MKIIPQLKEVNVNLVVVERARNPRKANNPERITENHIIAVVVRSMLSEISFKSN